MLPTIVDLLTALNAQLCVERDGRLDVGVTQVVVRVAVGVS